eukprot:COSAG02_NODE_714_length_18094_cov_13.275688_2_plen_60_part_00
MSPATGHEMAVCPAVGHEMAVCLARAAAHPLLAKFQAKFQKLSQKRVGQKRVTFKYRVT